MQTWQWWVDDFFSRVLSRTRKAWGKKLNHVYADTNKFGSVMLSILKVRRFRSKKEQFLLSIREMCFTCSQICTVQDLFEQMVYAVRCTNRLYTLLGSYST